MYTEHKHEEYMHSKVLFGKPKPIKDMWGTAYD
jgi:hypothetical protein